MTVPVRWTGDILPWGNPGLYVDSNILQTYITIVTICPIVLLQSFAKGNTTMSKEKSVEIKKEIRDLTDLIRQNMSHKEGGHFEVEGDIYEKSLPESIDLSTVKKLQKHNSDFVAAASLAVGEAGLDLMKSDKELQSASADFRLGNDKLSVVFDRAREIPGAKGEKETQLGVSNASYVVSAAGTKAALKSVREHLAMQAAAVLKG
jgi:hypothetical protein